MHPSVGAWIETTCLRYENDWVWLSLARAPVRGTGDRGLKSLHPDRNHKHCTVAEWKGTPLFPASSLVRIQPVQQRQSHSGVAQADERRFREPKEAGANPVARTIHGLHGSQVERPATVNRVTAGSNPARAAITPQRSSTCSLWPLVGPLRCTSGRSLAWQKRWFREPETAGSNPAA